MNRRLPYMKASSLIFATLSITTFTLVRSQAPTAEDFKKHFSGCKWDSPGFDKCVKEAINSCRPFFKTGVPAFNITPFDPWFANEVVQTRGGSSLSYTLKLKNVYERGWSDSIVTKFKSNPKKKFVQYTQYFPEKALDWGL
uniref:Urokinase-type plasminogen activator n=1 Tax=Lygus hesperus TaxID=30085 RepID=A0A0A9YC50_LYGHE